MTMSSTHQASSADQDQQQQQLFQKKASSRTKATALKLNGYTNLHKSSINISKERIVLQAWREIEDLPEEYVQHADMDSVVKMINSVAYFRKFWENGHEGPANPLPTKKELKSQNKRVDDDPEEVDIPQEFYFSGGGGGSSGGNNQGGGGNTSFRGRDATRVGNVARRVVSNNNSNSNNRGFSSSSSGRRSTPSSSSSATPQRRQDADEQIGDMIE